MDQSALRALVIGFERHIDRLITVNLERQAYECASAPSLESIRAAALRFAPTLAVIDDSRIDADDAAAELAMAGYGDIPVIKLSDLKTKPPLPFTLP